MWWTSGGTIRIGPSHFARYIRANGRRTSHYNPLTINELLMKWNVRHYRSRWPQNTRNLMHYLSQCFRKNVSAETKDNIPSYIILWRFTVELQEYFKRYDTYKRVSITHKHKNQYHRQIIFKSNMSDKLFTKGFSCQFFAQHENLLSCLYLVIGRPASSVLEKRLARIKIKFSFYLRPRHATTNK